MKPAIGVIAALLLSGCAPSAAANSAGCAPVTPPTPPGTSTTQTLTSGSLNRTYILHVPVGYQPTDATPLILAFHGSGESDAQIEGYSGLSSLDAVIAYPEGTTGTDGKASWQGAPYSSGADDVQFVGDLLNRLRTQLCVDKDRIYATGKSNGGGFTALLACALPRRIAAFAPVAGAYYPQTTVGCRQSPPVPVLEFHGTADPVIHYGGGTSHGEAYPSIPDWLKTWTAKDGCGADSRQAIGPDVEELDWSSCAAGTEVTHYRVTDGGHTWPGAVAPSGPGGTTHTISAAAIMWAFFARHPLTR